MTDKRTRPGSERGEVKTTQVGKGESSTQIELPTNERQVKGVGNPPINNLSSEKLGLVHHARMEEVTCMYCGYVSYADDFDYTDFNFICPKCKSDDISTGKVKSVEVITAEDLENLFDEEIEKIKFNIKAIQQSDKSNEIKGDVIQMNNSNHLYLMFLKSKILGEGK